LCDLDAQCLLVLGTRRDARGLAEHLDERRRVAARRAVDAREIVERIAVRLVVLDDLEPCLDRARVVAGALAELSDLGERGTPLRRLLDDTTALAQRIGERRPLAALAQDLDEWVE